MDFKEKLEKAISKNNSLLCIGLDPDRDKIPQGISLFSFNKEIIDKTVKLVCCFKLQYAFYSAEGIGGIEALKQTIDYLKLNHPNIPIIGDAKRGDIAVSSQKYALELFSFLNVDAATVNPYLGYDSLTPFFKWKKRGVIVVCRTSNHGASDFQDLKVNGEPLYIKIARKVVSWDRKHGNLMMVVGATWPQQIRQVRKIAPKMTFLVPGIGVQGGDLGKTLTYGLRKDRRGLIISSSRSIIYADNPQKAAQKFRDEINRYR